MTDNFARASIYLNLANGKMELMLEYIDID
jgi:hypothetical protein